jgi:lipopolysaccharide/colanic/teichoic acid biosynthesis glycosyltransferase
MTLSPAFTHTLQPFCVPAANDSQAADDLRDYIERLRYEDCSSGRLASVISIDAETADLLGDNARHYKALLNRLDANWAHENAVGWLDENRLGIVLPSASAEEAYEFAKSLCDGSHIPFEAVTVFGREVASCGVPRFLPLARLYVKRLPIWKRIIDIFGALILLIFALPILALASLLIKLTSQGPVLFSQWRVGLGGQPFCIHKLRTMWHDADQQKQLFQQQNQQDGFGFKIYNDPRVTTIGKILRRTSIDELPQLVNVLKGEMSLVGPRPLPCSDWKPHATWFCRRHDVPPGLTCTWQVSGRSEIGFEQWMQMDIDYIDSRTFASELSLLLRTVPAVLSQKGAS